MSIPMIDIFSDTSILKNFLEGEIKKRLKEYDLVTGDSYRNTYYVDKDVVIYRNQTIKHYMYNKIRINLNNYQRTHGWPSRLAKSVGFYGLLMFSIPDYYLVHKLDTTKLWLQDRTKAWREVVIYAIPNEYIQDVLSIVSNIPLNLLGSVIALVGIIVKNLTKTTIPIFENLISIGGLSDTVIEANWDKIKELLKSDVNGNNRRSEKEIRRTL